MSETNEPPQKKRSFAETRSDLNTIAEAAGRLLDDSEDVIEDLPRVLLRNPMISAENVIRKLKITDEDTIKSIHDVALRTYLIDRNTSYIIVHWYHIGSHHDYSLVPGDEVSPELHQRLRAVEVEGDHEEGRILFDELSIQWKGYMFPVEAFRFICKQWSVEIGIRDWYIIHVDDC